jgi:hypothetical protein
MKTYDFNNPKDAREYLAGAHLGEDKPITYIETSKRRIDFNNCTDEEACDAATILYEQIGAYQERVDQGLTS